MIKEVLCMWLTSGCVNLHKVHYNHTKFQLFYMKLCNWFTSAPHRSGVWIRLMKKTTSHSYIECFFTFANFDLSLQSGGFCVIRPRWWAARALEEVQMSAQRQGRERRTKMKGTCKQKEKNESQTERGFFLTKWQTERNDTNWDRSERRVRFQWGNS